MSVNRIKSFGIAWSLCVFSSSQVQAVRFDVQGRLEYITAVDVISIENIRSTTLNSWHHGLNPKSYWTESMEILYKSHPQSKELKFEANKYFVQLLSDISIGSIDPETLSSDIKIASKAFISPKQLMALIAANGQQADLVLESLAPQNPLYLALRVAMIRLYPACKDNTWVSLSRFKNVLRIGVRDPAVLDIKRRFSFLGYRMASTDDLVDEAFVTAVNDIEWNLRITPDATMHPQGAVWDFLNVSCLRRVHQLQADMEKVRWFPQNFSDRFIIVNTAFSYFIMVDRSEGQNVVIATRAINGRFERKTPTMKDEIVRIIFNPFWVVPPTIFIEDKLQEIRALPRYQLRHYFEQRNYEIWNSNFTRRLDPESIDWSYIDAETDHKIYIRQKPNYWNALGVVKFDLTNPYSIYLHDTNQRNLFSQPMRLLSSGCIRLENPLAIAEHLLRSTKWSRSLIDETVAKPGQIMSKDTEVALARPMPVFVISLTSQLTSDNVLRFTSDIYGQNEEILAKFKPTL